MFRQAVTWSSCPCLCWTTISYCKEVRHALVRNIQMAVQHTRSPSGTTTTSKSSSGPVHVSLFGNACHGMDIGWQRGQSALAGMPSKLVRASGKRLCSCSPARSRTPRWPQLQVQFIRPNATIASLCSKSLDLGQGQMRQMRLRSDDCAAAAWPSQSPAAMG